MLFRNWTHGQRKLSNSPTGLDKMPPKLAVSKPKSISPTSRQKHENSSMGVAMAQAERGTAAIFLPLSAKIEKV